ncbi:MAG: hypothetical protein HC869_01415 [Rhodospirillales bacterium]|nr:hypothetical protein [Rhodospirillales bacterium]
MTGALPGGARPTNLSAATVGQRFNPRPYFAPSDLKSAVALIAEWLMIVSAILVSEQLDSLPVYLLALVVISSRMVAISDVLGHDAIHGHLFSSRTANRAMEPICQIPFLYTFDSFRQEHFAHHRYLMTARDPTYRMLGRWGVVPPGPASPFFDWFVRPCLLFGTYHTVIGVLSDLCADRSYRLKMGIWWSIYLACIWVSDFLPELFYYWIVPLFLIVPVLNYWGEMVDHFFVRHGLTRNSGGLVITVLLSPYNDGFHVLHHRYPGIPWSRLREAQEALIRSGENAAPPQTFLQAYQEARRERNRPKCTQPPAARHVRDPGELAR